MFEKSRNWQTTFVSCLIVLFECDASGTGSQIESDLWYTNFSSSAKSYLEDSRPSKEFFERLVQEIPKSQFSAYDNLGPSSAWNWVRKINKEGYGVYQSLNDVGGQTFGNIIGDSLRETAVAYFPIDHWGNVAAETIQGIFGNTSEERVNALDPGLSAAQALWLDSDTDKKLEWGLRPWQADPYVYCRINLGHFKKQSAMVLELRTGYDIFKAERFEIRVTSPLTENVRISAATAVAPSRWGTSRNAMAASLGIERRIGKMPNASALFIGVKSNVFDSGNSPTAETVVRAGYVCSW